MTDFRRRLGSASAALAALVALGATAVTVQAQDVGLPIGSTPGAAEVEDLEGNTVDLASLVGQGKPALVEFWATWCPLCEALDPRLQDAKQRFGDRVDYFIVGVAVNQTPRRIRRHLEDHTPVGPVYFDGRGAAVRAYAAPTTSYVVILDATGKVAYTGTGSDQPIVETLEKLLGN
jgi:thiol-disulfide isomerase/thioredoxin